MKINKELLKGSTSIVILTMLAKKDMYGYEIIQEMKIRSGDVFSMKEGTLYPMLHSLEKDGAIEAYWVDTDEGRRRKYYKITGIGRDLLNIKQKEWKLFSEMMDAIVYGGGEECYE